jgi:hypothetical protein
MATPTICLANTTKPTSVSEFKECKETPSATKRYRFFFDSNYAYNDAVIDLIHQRFSKNSTIIIGANPQDKGRYEKARLKAKSLGILWSSNRIGQGMPKEFPSDKNDIDEYTRSMPKLKGLSLDERIQKWMAGDWIDKHREWLIQESAQGVFCTEWDNIHKYNATNLFLGQQRWERRYAERTNKKITTRIILKNIYPASAEQLGKAFERFKNKQKDGLDPSRFCPFAISEEHMKASDKKAAADILRRHGIVVGDTLNSWDYRTIPSRQPCGYVGVGPAR